MKKKEKKKGVGAKRKLGAGGRVQTNHFLLLGVLP